MTAIFYNTFFYSRISIVRDTERKKASTSLKPKWSRLFQKFLTFFHKELNTLNTLNHLFKPKDKVLEIKKTPSLRCETPWRAILNCRIKNKHSVKKKKNEKKIISLIPLFLPKKDKIRKWEFFFFSFIFIPFNDESLAKTGRVNNSVSYIKILERLDL